MDCTVTVPCASHERMPFNEAKWTASLSSGVEGCMCTGHHYISDAVIALTVKTAAFLLQACHHVLKLCFNADFLSNLQTLSFL